MNWLSLFSVLIRRGLDILIENQKNLYYYVSKRVARFFTCASQVVTKMVGVFACFIILTLIILVHWRNE